VTKNNGRTAGRRWYDNFDEALPGALADDDASVA